LAFPEIEAILLLIIIVSGILSVEVRSLVKAVMCLFIFTLSIGVLFMALGAFHVGLFQILAYSGGTIALFLAVIMLTRRVEES
jgi:NADH:ubiquinone oxidoreductase subunit 6 (subunit J)